jgi:hypothetical protein
MGKGAGDNHPPLFEKLKMAKLIYPPYFAINNGWLLHSVYILMKNA